MDMSLDSGKGSDEAKWGP